MNEELKIIISAQVDKLKQNVEKAKKEVKSFQDQVKAASKDVDSTMSKMGEVSGKALKGLATGAAAAVTALVGVSAATAEYRENQAKLATAFEAAGGSAEQATATYNDLYRVLGDGGQATEAANHLAKLTTEEKALSEWTNICQGIYATFGDSLPIESLTEAANETAKTGELTGALADALNWAGVSEDDFAAKLEACNSEAEREQLIRETLTGLYDEAAAKYEETAAGVLAQNEAEAQLQATMAALGEAMAPVLTAFTSFANDALAVVLPYVQQLAQDLLPVLQTTLEAVATALGTAFEWASQHKELLAVIGGIIATVVTAIGLYNAVAAIKAAMDAAQVTTVWALVSAYAAQAVAVVAALAPYIAIVAAIAAVIAIIVVCVKHWDEIKAAVAKAWDTIKTKTKEAVSNVVEKFNEMKSKASEKIEQMKTAVSEKVEAIKSAISQKFEAIKTAISEKIEAAKSAVSEKFNAIKSGITEKVNGAKTAVTTGFTNMVSSARNKCAEIVSSVSEKFNQAKEKINSVMEGAKNIVRGAVDALKGFFNFEWSLPKIKLPHFSISGSFSLNPPSIPKFSVSWYKLGGVFDDPTLFGYGGALGGLGEDGAEAIVPLEKNLQWLDKLASMLSDRLGGDTPVYLMVDGKVFAQTAISTINQQTRQTGKLALNIV